MYWYAISCKAPRQSTFKNPLLRKAYEMAHSRHVSSSAEKGFTLIELSIVLVLIGLIIGGVLKGQELMESTRLKMSISQWDAVKSAVNTFQDKYQALPGDYAQANTYIPNVPASTEGNGNGLIGNPANGQDSAAQNNRNYNQAPFNESGWAWFHLTRSDLLSGITIDTTTQANSLLPGKVSSSNFLIVYDDPGAGGTQKWGHWVRWQRGQTSSTATALLNAVQASEVDRKYDDGVATTGSIRAQGNWNCRNNAGTYNTTGNNNELASCTMMLELF
jgi:prepilin-type N-terminal cleavage/methylation domain-containing protein